MSSPQMRVVGMISGTSYDAIDVAAADLELADGDIALRPLGGRSVPYPPALRDRIAAVLPPASTTVEEVCRLDTELGQAFAAAAATGVADLCGGRADLVVSHGQTVFHWVDAQGRAQGTLQLGQPAWIAERTGLPVVSDLRSRDVARGGHGAPLASMFDVLLLADSAQGGAALNLGGIANMTVVQPGKPPLAYDIGPANALIDAATRQLHHRAYDDGGMIAASGSVDRALLADLLADPYYRRPEPKSTGKEVFHWPYLAEHLQRRQVGPDDVVATVTELTVRLVAAEVRRHGIGAVYVSGGGARNTWLLERLRAEQVPVRHIESLGVGADEKEAYVFALLGFLTVHGLAGTVPSCTGATGPAVLGSITPGAAALRLPEPVEVPPRRLVIESPDRPAPG